ncbi:amyloid protein-binding protein 2 [Caerostris darwini]|uniref:Amyloid protein-binding protein 2 n=1 Tax=Caerostris darwini TaxID=1538125 RepID=A0AAV4VZW6_9ARAC|nr:amyloid protein-binding protein 2 [Caerostris darwini]
MAQSLSWMPDSLYNFSVSAVVANYSFYEKDIRILSGPVLFDILYKLYKDGLLKQLAKACENLHVFEKLLKVGDKRIYLHNSLQALMDHGQETAQKLANAYIDACLKVDFYLMLVGFLKVRRFMPFCLEMCPQKTYSTLAIFLECYTRLLHAQNMLRKFNEAGETIKEAQACIEQIKCLKLDINVANIYGEFAFYYFIQSKYKEAYSWSNAALDELKSYLTPRVLIRVLCIASKAYVMKNKLHPAEFLIKHAVEIARKTFGVHSLVYAETLLYYGDYLLHSDVINHSVIVYQKALDIHIEVLGGKNLLVAIAHEELAYATYVLDYTNRQFKNARYHIQKALSIKESLLPADDFLLTSTKKIYALIIEEIAIDYDDEEVKNKLLYEAEDHHASALQVTKMHLGEINLQTAKHYGNLGRLYQSIGKYEKARKFILKAIKINQQIMGPNDFEASISLSHLASLYCYHMSKYEEAILLYKRAVKIGVEQFGKNFSGLEFDYKGLIRAYGTLGDLENASNMHYELSEWYNLKRRNLKKASSTSPLNIEMEIITPECISSYIASIQ